MCQVTGVTHSLLSFTWPEPFPPTPHYLTLELPPGQPRSKKRKTISSTYSFPRVRSSEKLSVGLHPGTRSDVHKITSSPLRGRQNEKMATASTCPGFHRGTKGGQVHAPLFSHQHHCITTVTRHSVPKGMLQGSVRLVFVGPFVRPLRNRDHRVQSSPPVALRDVLVFQPSPSVSIYDAVIVDPATANAPAPASCYCWSGNAYFVMALFV